jgi:hypothetical protein
MVGFWATFGANVKKDEQWVVAEITKGWTLLQNAEKTIQVDVKNLQAWIQSHHLSITNLLKGILEGFQVAGVIAPGLAPAVGAATLAVDAATAAIDALSSSVLAGSTPLSSIVNTYHAVKDAQTAVNAVLKTGTAQPATITPEVVAAKPVVTP